MPTRPRLVAAAGVSVWTALVLIALSALSAACSRSSGGTPLRQDPTPQASSRLFSGDDDFANIAQTLAVQLQRDPGNEPARVLFAAATLLGLLKSSAAPAGQLHDLFQRAGYDLSAAASFWTTQVVPLLLTGQGSISNTAPRGAEIRTFLDGTLLPALETFVAALEGTSPDFSWFIGVADLNQHPLSGSISSSRGVQRYELDHGDLLALAAGLNVLIAQARFVLAYDEADVDPNDFDTGDNPGLDPLLVIENSYPGLGNVAHPGQLAQCRARLTQAWTDYLGASAHIRGENAQRQQQGILTLWPDAPIPPAELAQLLADEANFRAWMSAVVADFQNNVAHLFTTGPGGDPLPPGDRFSVNFFRLFQGVNLRSVLFEVVADPLRGGRLRLGVDDLAQITNVMTTADGIVGTVGGVTPTAGDLQEDGRYAVRTQSPPVDTKTIDGNHGDWGSNAVRIGAAPAAAIAPSTVDLGDVFTAVDSGNLYLRVDADLQSLLDAAAWGWAELRVEWTGGHWAQVSLVGNGPSSVFTTLPTAPVAAVGAAGIEAAFPVPAGTGETWGKVGLSFFTSDLMPGTGNVVDSHRDKMFVRVR